jgi:D-galactose 1-dehydrogenase
VQPIRIAIVGVGKIARDQHIPAIAGNPAFKLAAAASRHAAVADVVNFPTIEALLDSSVGIDAVAICTPPQEHYDAARRALARGKHVLLEKPPCTSLAQFDHLVALAGAAGRTFYQTWHSRHAPGVAPAALLLQQQQLRRVHVAWKEDVRRWHPGQTWIWQAGGFGVLDPGINAFSILTQIIAEPLFAQSALLFVPSNCEAPIAAEIEFTSASGVAITVELDFRHLGTQTWTIDLQTDTGTINLSAGGSVLSVADERIERIDPEAHMISSEYGSIYRRFAQLIGSGQSEADARPLQLVADVFMVARHIAVEAFDMRVS